MEKMFEIYFNSKIGLFLTREYNVLHKRKNYESGIIILTSSYDDAVSKTAQFNNVKINS